MVRLICYNIEYCEGMEGLWYQYLMFWRIFFPPKKLDQQLVDALKRMKPDILTLVEVDVGSLRSRGKDEVRFIEQGLGMKSFVEKIKYPFQGWLRLFHHIPILDKQANGIAPVERFPVEERRKDQASELVKRIGRVPLRESGRSHSLIPVPDCRRRPEVE